MEVTWPMMKGKIGGMPPKPREVVSGAAKGRQGRVGLGAVYSVSQ